MLKAAIWVLMLPVVTVSQVIDSTQLPFGFYSSWHADYDQLFSRAKLGVIHNELGVNQFSTGGFDSTHIQLFVDSGIYVHPVGVFEPPGGNYWRNFQKYSHTTYYINHPDSSDFYSIGFKVRNGEIQGDYWAYRGSDYMLDNLKLKLVNRTDILDPQSPLQYYPLLKMKIDTTGTGAEPSDIAFIFSADNYNLDDSVRIRFIDTVYVGDLPNDYDTLLALTNQQDSLHFFKVHPDEFDEGSYWVKFRLEAVNTCSLFVDHFELYDDEGKNLVADTLYNAEIRDTTGVNFNDGKVLGYQLKDTIKPQNHRSNAHVSDLIRTATEVIYLWDDPVDGHPWFNAGGIDSWRDYIRVGQPEEFWAYLYPIDAETYYTGYSTDAGAAWQSSLNHWLVRPCDSIRTFIDNLSPDRWVVTLQSWWCDSTVSDCVYREQRRKPTRTELLCETYVALCYYPSGVVYWKYDTRGAYGNHGIMDENNEPDTSLYNPFKDSINPYIKAIDSTYLSLTWDDAYHIRPDSPMPGGWLDTIYAVSNSSDPNPDLGWFHVGQFTEGSDKYVMLVNRACSQGPENPAAAPSITATVKFDPTTLGLGNYVNIIDLADSIFFTSYEPDSVWEDTTYSAKMPDGTIPFTTVLGPGEGRLFKIVQASKRDLTYHDDELSSLQGR